MGIKNLLFFIRKRCLGCERRVHKSNFAGKTLGIDASIFMYKYKVQGDLYGGVYDMVCKLRDYKISPIFIFDGPPPKMKRETIKNRINDKRKENERLENLHALLSKYEKENVCDGQLIETFKTTDIDVMRAVFTHRTTANCRITKDDVKNLKMLLRCMGIPTLTADHEAETLCAQLFKEQKVDHVITDDSDILAYGCDRIIMNGDDFVILSYRDILAILNLSPKSFLDLCIMCGTDYNQNIPRIGPEKSYELISTHGSIDNITSVNTSILNHEKVRELFAFVQDIVSINPFTPPSIDELKKFMIDNNVDGRFNLRKLKPRIVFH